MYTKRFYSLAVKLIAKKTSDEIKPSVSVVIAVAY